MKLALGRSLLALGLLSAFACGGSGSSDVNGDPTPTPTTTTTGVTPPPGPPGPPGPPPNPPPSPTGKLQTVFMILMENHSWSTIKGSAAADYINNTLVPMGAHAEAYKTPPNNHPSEPNYIWLEAGDNLGITNDDAPSKNHQSTKDHLVTQLETANIPWKAYVEGIDGTKCPLTASGTYDPKHTPQLYFDDVTNTNQASSQSCISHVRPFTELATDLAANKAARYNFITPDLCNDMHGNGVTGDCSIFAKDDKHIGLGDAWLKANVPTILNSQAYKDGGVLFIVWDEGDESLGQAASDGPIGMLVLSPKAKKGFSSPTAFTHSSTLRTVETIFGVPYLRGAMNSNDLSEMFTSFP